MRYLNTIKAVAIVFIILWTVAEEVKAQTDDSLNDRVIKHTIQFPGVYKPLEFKSAVSVLFTRLPFDWVETTIDVPVLQYGARLGLPVGFTLDATVQTIWVSNMISLGPHWNFSLSKVSFGAGLDPYFMFGRMNISGFDNKAWGWGMSPNVSFGFTTKDIAFTIKGERKTVNSLTITSGSAEISKEKNFLAGWSIGLYMEQKLWKDHVMVLGLINNFQKFYYAAWPAFSTFNRNYYIPQIYIGLVL
jgi:hypothetical protein